MDQQPPTVEPAIPPVPPPTTEDPFAPKESHGRGRRLATVGILVAAALVIGGIVFALIWDSGSEIPNGGAGVSATPSPDAAAPLPPRDLMAKAKPFQVVLTWTGPIPADPDARYEVRRDEIFLAYVSLPERRFEDTNVIPDKRYAYEVRVETGDGLFSDPVRVRAKTPIPPIVQARVEGTFDVRTQFISKSGYGEYSAPTFGWDLTPVCPTGPCSVRLRDNFYEALRLKLDRSGAAYTGSFSGQIGLECTGTPMTSTGSIDLRVKRARVVDGEWQAVTLEGTMNHQEAQQLGCRSGSASLSIRARFIQ
jgi:hypothetical protein